MAAARVRHFGFGWSIALCVVVWVVSCWFLRGDLGRWNDDYLFHSIDPATGAALARAPIQTSPFFPPEDGLPIWRPLFFTVGSGLNTLLWHHPAVMHTVQVVLHLCVAGGFFALLRVLSCSRRAAVLATLIFIPCAPAFEVVFWTMAWPTVFATTLLMACMVMLARGMGGGRRARWWMVGSVLCALPVPLLNEQPAGCFLALPLVALGARGRGESWWAAAKRAAWPIGAVGAWCVGYAVLLVTNPNPLGGVGGAGEMVRLAHVWPAFTDKVSWVWKEVFERYYLREGPVGVAWNEVVAQPVWSVVCGAAALAAAVPGARYLLGEGAKDDPAEGEGSSRVGAVVLMAGALVVGSLLPVVLVNAPVRPRMTYMSWMGLCVVIAVCTDVARGLLIARGVRLLPVSACALAAAGVLVGWLTMAMIGTQVGYRERMRMDERIGAQFLAAMPDPPAGTVFFVLGAHDWPVDTPDNLNFEHYYIGGLAPGWSFPTFLQHVYRRTDIECASSHWVHPQFAAADERTVVPLQPMRFGVKGDAMPSPPPPEWFVARPGITAVAWDRVVLLETRHDGTVVLVERVVIDLPDGGVVTVTPPRCAMWKGSERIGERRLRAGLR